MNFMRIFFLFIFCFLSTLIEATPIAELIKETLKGTELVDGIQEMQVQPIIDYLVEHQNDQEALLQLLQPFAGEKTYLDQLFRKTSWDQWQPFTHWMVQADIPREKIIIYITMVLQHRRAFARYVSYDLFVQNIIDAFHEDADLTELIRTTGTSNLIEELYSYANNAQQMTLQKLFGADYEMNLKPSITKLLLLQQRLPLFVIPPYLGTISNTHQTQSKPHFFRNLVHTVRILNQCPEAVKKTLLAAYKKEQLERARGNYVFYHAQQWHLHFSADIYKQLWNIVYHDSVGDDFTFLRYTQQTTAPHRYYDHLFMNHALFGNARNDISCSATYFTNNHSVRPRYFSPSDLCQELKVDHIYRTYATEFQQLESLHEAASSHGNLLLISVPADKLSCVHPVLDGGYHRTVTIKQPQGEIETGDTQLILDTLIQDPTRITDSDDIEYTMPLTTAYALDPHHGPRIYSFNAADTVKFKAYQHARDALFAKIKEDIRTPVKRI